MKQYLQVLFILETESSSVTSFLHLIILEKQPCTVIKLMYSGVYLWLALDSAENPWCAEFSYNV